jgi:HTH-type transcriptional regulator/antitoxin HipB
MDNTVIRTPGQLIPVFSALRKQRGLSQAELARLMGVSQQTISQLERNPDKATMERLLRAFAVMDIELVVRARQVGATANAPPRPQSARKPQPSW